MPEPPFVQGTRPALDTAPLWRRWRAEGDPSAREQLIHHHLADARMLAAMVYGRRTHPSVEFEDYLQLARIGLIEAVDRFDPERGVQFKSFASKRIQGAVLSGLVRLTEKNHQIHLLSRLRAERIQMLRLAAESAVGGGTAHGATGRPDTHRDTLFHRLAELGIGVALGVLLEDTGMVDPDAYDSDARMPSPEISYFRKSETAQLRSMLRERVATLDAAHRVVIRGHYVQQMPFEEIARTMGLSRGRVSQIHRQALNRLRDGLRHAPPHVFSF